jgi:hypothetical protein
VRILAIPELPCIAEPRKSSDEVGESGTEVWCESEWRLAMHHSVSGLCHPCGRFRAFSSVAERQPLTREYATIPIFSSTATAQLDGPYLRSQVTRAIELFLTGLSGLSRRTWRGGFGTACFAQRISRLGCCLFRDGAMSYLHSDCSNGTEERQA